MKAQRTATGRARAAREPTEYEALGLQWHAQSEAQIQRDILRYLALRGETGIQRTNSGRRGGVRLARGGTADLTGVILHGRHRGRFCAVEVKTPGWDPHNLESRRRWQAQLAYLESVRLAGGVAFVASSVEDVERGLA